MITEEILDTLIHLRDEKYRIIQSRLIPSVSYEHFIGVRTPEIRKLAKNFGKREDIRVFLNELPHAYFDENQLHAFIIADSSDYNECIKDVDAFLPYIDNWATCDQMSPKVFKKHKDELSCTIPKWIGSNKTYTVRFGVKMLMEHFLNEEFDSAYPEMIARIRSEEYYVKMMIAWYFATALAKQYEAVLPYLEEHRLDTWIQNKAIQKALESYRISPEKKEYLRRMKVR